MLYHMKLLMDAIKEMSASNPVVDSARSVLSESKETSRKRMLDHEECHINDMLWNIFDMTKPINI